MRVAITIDDEILELLVAESGKMNKASAVREAIALYLKQKKVEKIMQMKDKVKFDRSAYEIRHQER